MNSTAVRLEKRELSTVPLGLGETRAFRVRSAAGPIKAQFFLRHEGIRYLRPLTHAPTEEVHIYTETPGRFTLYARRYEAKLGAGSAQVEFEVVGAPATAEPELVTLDRPCELHGEQAYVGAQVVDGIARLDVPAAATSTRGFMGSPHCGLPPVRRPTVLSEP